jgi:predicted nucleotidyltransferase/biotin operon repressor
MKQGIKVCVDVDPTGETEMLRSGVADEVLRLLVDAHETEFTLPELADATGSSRSTVWHAVDLLSSLGVLRIRETPQRKYVAIDPERLEKDDRILAIEQAEFYAPVRAFVQELQAAVEQSSEDDRLVGVVVFGSVARGEADRASDIDLFVVVDGDRTTARRQVADLVADLRERRFDGDRYEFEPYVESVESAHRAEEKLDEIFEEGITVYGTETLNDLRKAVFTRE